MPKPKPQRKRTRCVPPTQAADPTPDPAKVPEPAPAPAEEPGMTMPVHDDKSLKKIAIELYENKIFSSASLGKDRRGEALGAFTILALLDADQRRWMVENEIVFVYEYYTEAAERCCNGLPMFFSCRYLSREDTGKMFGFLAEYRKLRESFTG